MKNLILAISFVFLVGCGSSSSSSDDNIPLKNVDNSSLASGSSAEGYYGESVIFGNHLASQWWTMTYQGESERFLLKSNGDGIDAEDINTGYTFDYGISKDGRTMNRNNSEMIFYIIKPINSRCYNVDLTGEDYDTGNKRTLNITMSADGV